MSAIPERFAGVTAVTKANVYFDGRVVSHTLLFPDGTKKTLGLIYTGAYRFSTGKAERMELIAGACKVKSDGQPESRACTAGQAFEVPANSAFDIKVEQGICEYICSYLD